MAFNNSLTSSELATILAALRAFQVLYPPDAAVCHFPEHFEDCEPLDSDAINELCEKLNTEDT